MWLELSLSLSLDHFKSLRFPKFRSRKNNLDDAFEGISPFWTVLEESNYLPGYSFQKDVISKIPGVVIPEHKSPEYIQELKDGWTLIDDDGFTVQI